MGALVTVGLLADEVGEQAYEHVRRPMHLGVHHSPLVQHDHRRSNRIYPIGSTSVGEGNVSASIHGLSELHGAQQCALQYAEYCNRKVGLLLYFCPF
jgi:hypothetical protein